MYFGSFFYIFQTSSEGLWQRWKSEIAPHCVTNDRIASEGVARKQDLRKHFMPLSFLQTEKSEIHFQLDSNDSHTPQKNTM